MPDPITEVTEVAALPALTALRMRQHGALARSQASSAGRAADFDADRDAGLLVRRHRGVGVGVGIGGAPEDPDDPDDPDDPAVRAWAALLTQARGERVPPGVAASHATAGRLWQLDEVPDDGPEHVTVPRLWTARQRPGVRLHRASMADAQYGLLGGGLPVTSPVRTVLDLARVLDRTTAVVVADSALRRRLCTVDDLRTGVDLLAGLRHVERARLVVRLADAGTDSCQETRLRLVIVDGGLPRPTTGVCLVDADGRVLARADLAYEDLLIWLEYDGFAPHIERAQFRKDRARTRWLEIERGWHVVSYCDADLSRPAGLVAQLRRLVAEAPARVAALDPTLSPEVRAARSALGLR